MRVTVTGGAGFIGANLCAALADLDEVDHVVALDDLSTGAATNLAATPAVELIEGTILDPRHLDRAFAGADAVVHLAARGSVPRSVADPMGAHRVNVTGTAEVLEAVRRAGGPQLVVASSSSVYGDSVVLPKREDQAPRPQSPYAASKLATEAYALAWARVYGLEVLALRFFNVFGPLQPVQHDYAAVVPAFVSAALAGRPLPMHGDGRQSRDFTYVGSVCRVLADAVRRRVTSPAPVNLAFGSRVTLLELVAELEQAVGHPLPIEHGPVRAGDVRHTRADTTELAKLFPDATPLPLAEGLAATVAWFRTPG